jgi:uncharacterized protein YkwD
MRKLIAVPVILVGLLLAACTPEEGHHLTAVNDFRGANGQQMLTWDEDIYNAARNWSQHMADAGALSHPEDLAANFAPPAGWHKVGQNVAEASTLDQAMTALENSPPHRHNLLDPGFTQIAVGVVQANGLYWVTEDFLG